MYFKHQKYPKIRKISDFHVNLNNSRENNVSLHQKSEIMRYKIKKETKPTLPTFGKYKAVAVHYQTIESKQIIKETAQRTSFSEGNIIGVLMSVAEVVNDHLRDGDKVRLQDWGLMKLEIESEKVDDAKAFRPKKHIRGVRLHFIPESSEGSQPLYDGITFEKDPIR